MPRNRFATSLWMPEIPMLVLWIFFLLSPFFFAGPALQIRLKWRLNQLKTYTLYAIIVQAFNGLGAGPKSAERLVTTMEDGKSIRC